MKNVMIYNIVDSKRRHNDHELQMLLRCQIENSLHYGWAPEDIIIGTNFEFEYKGIRNYTLKDICTFNIFNNKWYGMYELMLSGILDDDFWFHDQDNWQVNPMEFPTFDGQIGATTYVKTPEWNTGVVYVKRNSIDCIGYIVESMKMNPVQYHSDENWITYLRQNSEIANLLSVLNTEYCVGYTYYQDRINAALGNIKCLGFMPDTESHHVFYETGLIPEHLENILQLRTIDAFKSN